jgi:hypothetical protein
MIFILDYDTVDLTQAFNIKTDIENSFGVVCPYTVAIAASSPAYATLSGPSEVKLNAA